MIVQEIEDIARGTGYNIGVIPNNMEKYMSFTLGKNIMFIDSLQFMNSSMEKLNF